jgi:atypical dual specificity phosphatase
MTDDKGTDQVLAVRGLGAAFGTRVVLAELDFTVPCTAITALLGPTGSGKSTLLRALAGLNAANPRYQQWGSVLYQGRELQAEHPPRLVQQNAKLLRASTLDALAEAVRATTPMSPTQLRTWTEAYVERMGFPELATMLDRPTMDLPLVQQRAVAILAEAAAQPALLLVDEPTADLSDYDAYLLLDLLRALARDTAVLVVLHNQRHAQMVAQHMVLLAGGRIQEARPMEDFLSMPISEAGMQFVRTGSCAVPAPDADPATLDANLCQLPPALPAAAQIAVAAAAASAAVSAAAAAPAAIPASTHTFAPTLGTPIAPAAASAVGHASATVGPQGFAWLVPGKIAGTPLPGIVNSLELDLAALQRAGITTLITLTERDLPLDALKQAGMSNLHLPIYDREPPTVAQIQMLLRRMEILLAKGQVLAVHCFAGLGRTGTVLAAWWVREGLTAHEALRRVRLINPDYVQHPEQEAFLTQYEDTILSKIV